MNSRKKGPILKESKFAFSAVIDVKLLPHIQKVYFVETEKFEYVNTGNCLLKRRVSNKANSFTTRTH